MRKLLRLLAILLLAGFILVSVSCRCGPTNVAAVVNGEKIYLSEVEAELKDLKSRHKEMFEGSQGKETEKLFKERILDDLIEKKLILQEAEKRGIKVTTKEVEAKLKQVKGMFKSLKQFQETLKEQGWTEKDLRENIREQLLIEKMTDEVTKNVKVTDSEVKAYYEKNEDKFKQSAQVKARHILLKTKSEAEKALKEAKGELILLVWPKDTLLTLLRKRRVEIWAGKPRRSLFPSLLTWLLSSSQVRLVV